MEARKSKLYRKESYSGPRAENETEQDFDHFIKVLLANQEAPISIIDAGYDWDKDLYHEICEMADYIFFVAEPDLHQLLKDSTSSYTKGEKACFILSFRENEDHWE